MLGNRSLNVQLVKTPKTTTDASGEIHECEHVDLDKISNLVLEHTQNIAKIAGTAYIAKRLLDTVCQIAVITAKHKLK